jgi:hypothetical protein
MPMLSFPLPRRCLCLLTLIIVVGTPRAAQLVCLGR